MKMNKVLLITIAFISFSLGTIGIFFPIIPTVPLYLLAAFCFANSSKKLHNWFLNTKQYKNYVLPYKKAGGLTKKAKKILILGVSIQILITAYIIKNNTIVLLILGLLYLGFLSSILFFVKTINLQK